MHIDEQTHSPMGFIELVVHCMTLTFATNIYQILLAENIQMVKMVSRITQRANLR